MNNKNNDKKKRLILEYIKQINKIYQDANGDPKEDTLRTPFENLINYIINDKSFTVQQEPKKNDYGIPDFLILNNNNNIRKGYIETKKVINLNELLKDKRNAEQLQRYSTGLDNLILTNYIDFQFYRHFGINDEKLRSEITALGFNLGEKNKQINLVKNNNHFIVDIEIAKIQNGKIIAIEENFDKFINLINLFIKFEGLKINNAEEIAEQMADKAKHMAYIVEKILNSKNEENNILKIKNRNLLAIYDTFCEKLIPSTTKKEFADIYAQTITYGIFIAKIESYGKKLSIDNIAELIPENNQFLRNLFNSITGVNKDPRIDTSINTLLNIFKLTNIKEIMENEEDPFIYFYENFLMKYDNKQRKELGAYYTPKDVVKFIVKITDEILKDKFNIKNGLADKSKIKIKDNEYHKVQILEPATGTGTFLSEIIKFIHKSVKRSGQLGNFNNYIKNDLIKRLHGFEISMASYAVANIKIKKILEKFGYKLEERLSIYLTNTLEDTINEKNLEIPFAQWLADEARGANEIKRNNPIMVVIGNPPYNRKSKNKSDFIVDLCKPYKENLNEKSIGLLSDDYIKFIRYGEHLIENNKEGILAYITNNTYLSGITHRQMRTKLMQTFDEIYIIDLNGSGKTINDIKDVNVFDIKQPNCITFFIKYKNNNNNDNLAKIYYRNIIGSRELKFDFLDKNKLKDIDFQQIKTDKKYKFFVPKDFSKEGKYLEGFKITDLFEKYSSGITTGKDDMAIKFTKKEILNVKKDIEKLDIKELSKKYDINEDRAKKIKQDIINNNPQVQKILYRPFDIRYTLYTGKVNGFMSRPAYSIMKNIIEDNSAPPPLLILSRGTTNELSFSRSLMTKDMMINIFDGRTRMVPLILMEN